MSRKSKIEAAVDRLADVIEGGHLLTATGGAELLVEAARVIESLRVDLGEARARIAKLEAP